jgi:hypothetical protein
MVLTYCYYLGVQTKNPPTASATPVTRKLDDEHIWRLRAAAEKRERLAETSWRG